MTIPEIAAAHGHKADTLRKHARALGLAPRGRDFHLSPREVQRVLAAIATAKPGRPRVG